MSSRCQHVGVFTKDIEKMSIFYQANFGFYVERDYVAPADMMKEIFRLNSLCRIVLLALDNFRLELFQFERADVEPRKDHTSGMNHWCIMVQDKYAVCAMLERQGVEVVKIEKPHGHTFFIRDPEDNLVEVKNF